MFVNNGITPIIHSLGASLAASWRVPNRIAHTAVFSNFFLVHLALGTPTSYKSGVENTHGTQTVKQKRSGVRSGTYMSSDVIHTTHNHMHMGDWIRIDWPVSGIPWWCSGPMMYSIDE